MNEIDFIPLGENSEATVPKLQGSFRIVSWNTLADQYCHYQMRERPNDQKVFDKHRRHRLLGKVFRHFVKINADFICLQEVDFKIARQTLVDAKSYTRLLTPTGYGRGDTRVDACCIFYKSADWDIVGKKKIVNLDDLADADYSSQKLQKSFRRGNFGIIACFVHRLIPNKRIVICNTHLYWNPEYEYVKLRQAHYLCVKAKEFLHELKDSGVETHLIFCGDLNSQPGSLVHEYLSMGEVPTQNCPSFLEKTLECPLRHLLFESIHSKHDKGGPVYQKEDIEYTNSTVDFHGVIDYIFHPYSLFLTKILSTPTFNGPKDGRKYPVLPTKEWPSDHMAIGAEFSFEE